MTIDDFLSCYEPNVRDVCIALRKTVLELLPETEEILFEGWKNISYGTGESRSDKDLILYIAPFKESVNLGLSRSFITDKKKQLKGTGKLLRHLKFRSMTDYDLSDIRQLNYRSKSRAAARMKRKLLSCLFYTIPKLKYHQF